MTFWKVPSAHVLTCSEKRLGSWGVLSSTQEIIHVFRSLKKTASPLSASVFRIKPSLDHWAKVSSPSLLQHKSREQVPALHHETCSVCGGMLINRRWKKWWQKHCLSHQCCLTICLDSDSFVISSGMERLTSIMAEDVFWSHVRTATHTTVTVCRWNF